MTVDELLVQLKGGLGSYREYSNYYRGRHRLRFATEKFRSAFGLLFREFADNLMAPVINAVSDHLEIEEFVVDEDPFGGGGSTAMHTADRRSPHVTANSFNGNNSNGTGGGGGGGADGELAVWDQREAEVWEIWKRNRMDLRAGLIHTEALTGGDSYAIVWPDVRGQAVVYPQRGCHIAVSYDEEELDRIDLAIKVWDYEKYTRLNVYYPDRIEKYVSRNKSDFPVRLTSYALIPAGGGMGEPVVTNPWGRVPVFHFANDPDIGHCGHSEIHDAVPIQDALNKSVLDMLVAMEFAALPQRWVTGIEVPIGEDGKPVEVFKPGIDRLWLAEGETARFGEFGAANLGQFLSVSNDFRMEIARLSRTPLHYFFMQQGTPPSGEALKTTVAPFTKKVGDRQTAYGNVWEDLMSFAHQIDHGGDGLRLVARWVSAAPRSDKELSETLINLSNVGASDRQLLSDWGYTERQIEAMKLDNEAAQQAALDLMEKQFNAGTLGGGSGGGGLKPPRPVVKGFGAGRQT